MSSMLITSAGELNGGGQDALLSFTAAGEFEGRFTEDSRVVDPRGMTLDPDGRFVYLNTANRIVALDRTGRVMIDSGPIAGLDPGGAVFGPDGRLYVTARQRGTILAIARSLRGPVEPVLPERVVPFPRGFGFGADGSLYLASGIGPSGGGDNTIVSFDAEAGARPRVLVEDAGLSPLDLTVAPGGNIVVASESPFGAPAAVVTVREYDPNTGALIRVFTPDPVLGFRRPRGLRFGVDSRLYCVGEAHVIAFDFVTGEFVGPVVELNGLHGQAVVLPEWRGGAGGD
jgi:DNA-binding beta-propeller fold protein YncE